MAISIVQLQDIGGSGPPNVTWTATRDPAVQAGDIAVMAISLKTNNGSGALPGSANGWTQIGSLDVWDEAALMRLRSAIYWRTVAAESTWSLVAGWDDYNSIGERRGGLIVTRGAAAPTTAILNWSLAEEFIGGPGQPKNYTAIGAQSTPSGALICAFFGTRENESQLSGPVSWPAPDASQSTAIRTTIATSTAVQGAVDVVEFPYFQDFTEQGVLNYYSGGYFARWSMADLNPAPATAAGGLFFGVNA